MGETPGRIIELALGIYEFPEGLGILWLSNLALLICFSVEALSVLVDESSEASNVFAEFLLTDNTLSKPIVGGWVEVPDLWLSEHTVVVGLDHTEAKICRHWFDHNRLSGAGSGFGRA